MEISEILIELCKFLHAWSIRISQKTCSYTVCSSHETISIGTRTPQVTLKAVLTPHRPIV